MKKFVLEASFCLVLALWLGGSVPLPAQQPVSFAPLHMFGSITSDGRQPFVTVILGQGNILYGSTRVGGTNNAGTLFKVNIDGVGYAVLYSFSQGQSDGGPPPNSPGGAPLVQGADGMLYGIVFGGSTNGNGFAFKLNPDGTGFTVLHAFGNIDGGPVSLMQCADGFLYGSAYFTLFKFDTNGGTYTVLRQFTNSIDGNYPLGKLTQDTEGALYGTAYRAGTNGEGTVFKINTDGSGYQVLHTFSPTAWTAKDPGPAWCKAATALFMEPRPWAGRTT